MHVCLAVTLVDCNKKSGNGQCLGFFLLTDLGRVLLQLVALTLSALSLNTE